MHMYYQWYVGFAPHIYSMLQSLCTGCTAVAVAAAAAVSVAFCFLFNYLFLRPRPCTMRSDWLRRWAGPP